MREWRYPKIDLNELKMYGGKGVRYTREDMDMIPVDVASLVKIREITKVNDVQVDDEEKCFCVINRQFYIIFSIKKPL